MVKNIFGVVIYAFSIAYVVSSAFHFVSTKLENRMLWRSEYQPHQNDKLNRVLLKAGRVQKAPHLKLLSACLSNIAQDSSQQVHLHLILSAIERFIAWLSLYPFDERTGFSFCH